MVGRSKTNAEQTKALNTYNPNTPHNSHTVKRRFSQIHENNKIKKVTMSKLNTQKLTRYEVPTKVHILNIYLQTHSTKSKTMFHKQLKQIERRFESKDEQTELDTCMKHICDFLAK